MTGFTKMDNLQVSNWAHVANWNEGPKIELFNSC